MNTSNVLGGGDDRWPCFLEERQAISWMRDRLSRGRVFAGQVPASAGASSRADR
jgi:hypothetical protein